MDMLLLPICLLILMSIISIAFFCYKTSISLERLVVLKESAQVEFVQESGKENDAETSRKTKREESTATQHKTGRKEKGRQSHDFHVPAEVVSVSNKELEAIQEELGTLKRRSKDMDSQIDSMQNTMKELVAQFEKLKEVPNVQDANIHTEVIHPQSLEANNSQQSLQQTMRTYYAKEIDSENPFGFMMSKLRDDSQMCAFIIHLNDKNEGEYSFVDNEDVRRDVLKMFDVFITPSSDYDSIPVSPKTTKVTEPGKVLLENGVLKITKKQKIVIE